jgi:RHS repeat-associated protein
LDGSRRRKFTKPPKIQREMRGSLRYHPFGSTAFHIADSNAEVSAKRYRYTGKERDEETGLYYHGARYYAPWLGRWTSADPKGIGDGPNVYLYVGNNPISYLDPDGAEKSIWDTFKPGGTVFESVDSLFNKNESPVTAAVLNNLSDRGEGIVEGVKQQIKETAEDYADIAYYSTHANEPGAANKVGDAVKRRVTAPVKQAVGAVQGFVETVKRVGDASGDIAYYSTHSEEAGSGAKIASAVTDIVLDTPTIVLTLEGGANLAKGASKALKTPPRKAPVSAPPKQLPPGPAAPKQLAPGPPPPKQLSAGPAAPKQLPAGGQTTQTLEKVRRVRGGPKARGSAYEQHLAEANAGTREVSVDTQLGKRRHDVRADNASTKLAHEGKNYLEYRTVGGKVVRGEVPLSAELRTQARKDFLWVREGKKLGEHRVVQWNFAGAPPSAALAGLLRHFRIPYVTR